MTIGLDASLDSFDKCVETLNSPENICKSISCHNNEYFDKNCADSFSCKHVCERNEYLFCGNKAKCVPLIDKNYEPKCM